MKKLLADTAKTMWMAVAGAIAVAAVTGLGITAWLGPGKTIEAASNARETLEIVNDVRLVVQENGGLADTLRRVNEYLDKVDP